MTMEPEASVEQLYCALLFLLSRHARSPQPHLPGVINDHLRWLAAHPDLKDLPKLRETCSRLALHWHAESGDGTIRRNCSWASIIH